MRPPQSSEPRIEIPDADVSKIHSLYRQGLYLQAYEHVRTLPPLAQWAGTGALLIAGRLANNLEAPKLGRWLHARAWRENRASAEAACHRAYSLVQSVGPLRAWQFIHRLPKFPEATAEARAGLLSLRAELAATFRDFERAQAWLREAEQTDRLNGWICTSWAFLHRLNDAYDEALAAARRGLEQTPWYRPALQMTGEVLTLLDRDDEAIELLREGMSHVESAAVAQQLAGLLIEKERYEEARHWWERSRELAPIMEPDHVAWWHGRMSDAHYFLGHLAEAAEHARQAGKGFHEKIAGRLAAPVPDARRVHLKVPFVRQHEMTCAPATLSALSRYWKVEVDHLELARRICYDGTPGHVERHWAEENGYVVREFRVDWDTAVALLDRGVPFAISTVETASAHAQAVVGYDTVRGTLIVRDPYLKLHSEAHGESWLKVYEAFGPRGLVFVPQSEAPRLEGVALPEAALYDRTYRVDRALHVHDTAAAEAALAELESAAPGHRLSLFARRQLSFYHASVRRAHEAGGELLKLFPANNHLRWSRVWSLRDLAPRPEYRAYLASLATGENAEPLFWREYADDLRQDARGRAGARRWLLRALHHQPTVAEFLASMAFLRWDERQFEEAAGLLRLAACLRDKAENFTQSWFLAARHLRRHDEVLAVLETRFVTYGKKSASPLKSLFWALCLLDRQPEAFARLETALGWMPDDGDLLLFAADMQARHGHRVRAAELLEHAQMRSNRAIWLRTAAAIAEYGCDLRSALARWRDLLNEEPLAMDAQEAVARLVAQLEGRAAAIAHLEAQCTRFPHHILLHRARVEWLRVDGADAAEAALRAVLALEPGDAWAHRELALLLAEQRRFEEAFAACEVAQAIEPDSTTTHGVRGVVLRLARREAEAREACRQALRLSVDHGGAMQTLMMCSATFEEKKETLAFVRGELIAQTVYGDGLLAYHDLAFPVLAPEELLANLREALAARPDLWHAWSAVATQLLHMGSAAEARDLAKKATDLFPLLPRVWHDLGRIQMAAKAPADAVESFRQALAIHPAWGEASRSLSSALQLCERYEDARAALEAAVAASPLEAANHAALAEVLWRKDRAPAAIEKLHHVLELSPDMTWAWERLAEWTAKPGEENPAVALARELAAKRPGETRSWLRLAELLPPNRLDEALAALDRARQTDPRHVGVHDTRVWLLTRAGRFDDALAACRPAVFGEEPPIALQARAAWVTRERGHIEEARDLMRAVVKASPDLAWGWEMLAAWHNTLKEHEAEREAAQQLVRLNPGSSLAYAYLAQAEQSLGHRRQALEALHRAWEADPSFEYAAYNIFDVQMEASDPAIERTLEKLRVHLPGARTQACEVRYACKKDRRKEALAVFDRLLRAPEHEAGRSNVAAAALAEKGWAKEAAKVIETALSDPAINSHTGDHFVTLLIAAKRTHVAERVRRLPSGTPVGRAARIALLETAGSSLKASELAPFLAAEGQELQKDVRIWGVLLFAIIRCNLQHQSLAYVEGWEARQDLEPWMLHNVAEILRHHGREAEAAAANRQALGLPPDGTFNSHHAWLALDAALDQRFDAWKVHRDSVAHDRLDEGDRALLVLAKGVNDVLTAPQNRREDKFTEVRERLLNEKYLPFYQTKLYEPQVRRAVELMATASNSSFRWAKWLSRLRSQRLRQATPTSERKPNTFWIYLILILLYVVFRILAAASK